MNPAFLNALKENNWIEISHDWKYLKGNWLIHRDTSSWWMIFLNNNHKVFDFFEPNEMTAKWTVNLIEKLCSSEANNLNLNQLK